MLTDLNINFSFEIFLKKYFLKKYFLKIKKFTKKKFTFLILILKKEGASLELRLVVSES